MPRPISKKQQGAERFASVFAPKSEWRLWLRNLVISAFAIPGLARFSLGKEIADTVRLPDYGWRLTLRRARDEGAEVRQ